MFNADKAREALKALNLAGEARRWQAATFLHRTAGLDMAILGELLGRHDHQPLMHAYICRLDLRGLNLERALRALLSGFRLPGEAQKIDRILDQFAKHWHAQNVVEPGDATPAAGGAGGAGREVAVDDAAPPAMSSDTIFIVSFALIMLNTDLHNPAIKKARKMTLQGFTSNLRGQGPGGGDLPAAWLAQLYHGIARDEIRLKGDSKTSGASAAIVPGLTLEALRRLRAKWRVHALLVLATVRMRRLAAAREADAAAAPPSHEEHEEHEELPARASRSSSPASTGAAVRRRFAKLLSPRQALAEFRQEQRRHLPPSPLAPPSSARHRRQMTWTAGENPRYSMPSPSVASPAAASPIWSSGGGPSSRHSTGSARTDGSATADDLSHSLPLGWGEMARWRAPHAAGESPAPAPAARRAGGLKLMRPGSAWSRRPRKRRAAAEITSPASAGAPESSPSIDTPPPRRLSAPASTPRGH